MGMMHNDCYAAFRSAHSAKVYRVKYTGACEAGDKCLHGGTLNRGEECCYTRRNSETTSAPAPVSPADPVAIPASSDPVAGALAAILMPLVQARIDAKVNETLASVDPESIIAECESAIQAKIDALSVPRTLEVKRLESGETVNVGIQHRMFPTLLKALSAGVNVWIAGPSGSGKTTAAKAAAKSLGLSFRYTGAVGDPYALAGFKNAQGDYMRTPFREAYETGGVFLWDEIDASDANATLWFNAALENGIAAFPDGMVERHADCLIIGAANTWGGGASREYVGRNRLDAAFLKRFARISWEYDNELELNTAPNREWTLRVQAVRKRVAERGLRVLVTPRESYIGARLLAAGIPQDEVEAMTIKADMTDDQWHQVRA